MSEEQDCPSCLGWERNYFKLEEKTKALESALQAKERELAETIARNRQVTEQRNDELALRIERDKEIVALKQQLAKNCQIRAKDA